MHLLSTASHRHIEGVLDAPQLPALRIPVLLRLCYAQRWLYQHRRDLYSLCMRKGVPSRLSRLKVLDTPTLSATYTLPGKHLLRQILLLDFSSISTTELHLAGQDDVRTEPALLLLPEGEEAGAELRGCAVLCVRTGVGLGVGLEDKGPDAAEQAEEAACEVLKLLCGRSGVPDKLVLLVSKL